MIENQTLLHDQLAQAAFRKSMLMADSMRTRSKSKRYFYRLLESNHSPDIKSSALLALALVAYWDKNFIECQTLSRRLVHEHTYSRQSLFALSLLYQMHKRMGKTHTLEAITNLSQKITHRLNRKN